MDSIRQNDRKIHRRNFFLFNIDKILFHSYNRIRIDDLREHSGQRADDRREQEDGRRFFNKSKVGI